ncbi:unnamed protein product [Phaedon cochleariae]|uniref:CHK kinase-like domain-containing protein n=1 Tax=Phaedon cochleariae TaxID=80249 RepID=A0A9N9X4C9_PHACE|nr:unnamed protein product [Phaedon cochleariae]
MLKLEMQFEAKKFDSSDVLGWIRQSLENENVSNLNIQLNGSSDGKNNGFASDMLFATATGVDQKGDKKDIRLAIKASKEFGHAASDDFLKLLFEREVLVYQQLFPTLKKFQQDKNITAPFDDAVPKCYKTFTSVDNASVIVLVLQDLNQLGYKLHDKMVSLDVRHIRLVLEQYSKFHALSFAFRDQRPEEFKAVAEKFFCHSEGITNGSHYSSVRAKISQNLREASREDLADQFEKVVDRGVKEMMVDILRDEVEQSVIIHGDCHSNNFMYRYEEGIPTKVMILDWQLSFQHSPILDLSYFLYQVAGENLNELRELLEFYHRELTKNLEALGTDASKVFPFSSLLEHWEKYSFYGFIFTVVYLDLFFVEEGTKVMFGNSNMKIKYIEAYRRKLIPAVDNYCNYKL